MVNSCLQVWFCGHYEVVINCVIKTPDDKRSSCVLRRKLTILETHSHRGPKKQGHSETEVLIYTGEDADVSDYANIVVDETHLRSRRTLPLCPTAF